MPKEPYTDAQVEARLTLAEAIANEAWIDAAARKAVSEAEGRKSQDAQIREHELKTWPPFFQAILDGDKTFEVRKNDRGFQRGDTLWLREWDPDRAYGSGAYTLRECYQRVSYVLTGENFGIKDGYCVMGLTVDA